MIKNLAALYGKEKPQAAQGMVEFALVLPILLLLMIGIFGFGHLFFTYTLAVAAGREAARFGVATGLSDRNLPRFRDCDAIRAAAVRVGDFAGVNTNNITITYDQGPNSDGITPAVVHPHGCPVGGIGPGYIDIGDRIVVAINLTYEPFFTFGFIPEIPIDVVTRRTIIRTMPIDDGLVATGSECVGTITLIWPETLTQGQLTTSSYVGEDYVFELEVVADDPDVIAPGTLNLYIDDADYASAVCTGVTGGSTSTVTCSPVSWDENETGDHIIRAQYIPDPPADPDTDPCYTPSKAEPWTHRVEPANTVITQFTAEDVDPPTSPTYTGDDVFIIVVVSVVDPAAGIPRGTVEISENGVVLATIPVPNLLNQARGTTNIQFADPGEHILTAVFLPEANVGFRQSPPETLSYTVILRPTETLIPSPTAEPTATLRPVPTDTPTATPTTDPYPYPNP